MDVLRAAQRLDRTGFTANKFSIPRDDGVQIGSTPLHYVNWPTGFAVINGALLRLGVGTIGLRLIALVLAGSAIGVFYYFVVHITQRKTVALGSALWFATLAPFRLLADSFSYMSWDWLGRSLCLFSCVKLADLPQNHRRLRFWQLAVALVPVLSLAILGIEMLPGGLFFGTLYSFLFAPVGERWRCFFRVWVPLAIGTVGGFAIRMFHARWVFGSFDKAIDHIRSKAGYRLGGANSKFSFAYTWGMRLLLYFGPGLAILCVVAFPLVRRLLRNNPSRIRLAKIFGLLAAADLLWPVAARQHSTQHTHTAMHLFFSTSLLFGLLVGAGVAQKGFDKLVIGGIATACLITNLFVLPFSTTGNIADNLDWSRTRNITRILNSGNPQKLPVWVADLTDPSVPFFLTAPYGLTRGQTEIANRTLPLTLRSSKQKGRLLASQFSYRMYSEKDGLGYDALTNGVNLTSATSGIAPGGVDGYTLTRGGSVTFRFDNQSKPTAVLLALTSEGTPSGASFEIEHTGPNQPLSRVQSPAKSGVSQQRVPVPFGNEQVLKISLRCDDAIPCDSAKFGFGFSMEY
jgi:hypothetical protein